MADDPPSRWRPLSVRILLLLVVLVPTFGMVAITAITASEATAERRAARDLERETDALVSVVEARAAVADVEVLSSVLTIGAGLGADPEMLSELYGVDYASELADARAEVDANPVLSGNPEVSESLAGLRALRDGIDGGTVAFAEFRAAVRDVTLDLDTVWRRSFEGVALGDASENLTARIRIRLEALDETYQALATGSDRASLTIQLLLGEPTTDDIAALLEADARFNAAIEAFSGRLGPEASAAWEAHLTDAASQRFEAALDEAARLALTGEESPLSTDLVAFGDAFIDGAPWAANLTDTVRAAAADLHNVTNRQADEAEDDLRTLTTIAAVLTLLSLAGALLLARTVVRPMRRLEDAAHQIQAGRFDLPLIDTRGPKELSDTARAFNEMASTLSAVESHAVALADDPDAPILNNKLPGRTGRALQVALNRLRSSIQVAEQHRRKLHEAATHDDLTGLLNRSAAFEVIERDIARVTREGGAVMALFIDLDGLKEINDEYGHSAGDDALRLTADALRASTRASDVVARIGGDEFLVAGIVHDVPAEVETLAERVRQAVADQNLECPEGSVPLRCSVGMALAHELDSPHTLMRKADAALYVAKGAGKNRIAWRNGSEASQGTERP